MNRSGYIRLPLIDGGRGETRLEQRLDRHPAVAVHQRVRIPTQLNIGTVTDKPFVVPQRHAGFVTDDAPDTVSHADQASQSPTPVRAKHPTPPEDYRPHAPAEGLTP
ncbi:hypothetical protein FrEUN1fDRAFT_6605 [Parafrankia sp. EUN1f]|nr:hypothetical protein FrEUN1fDRAFT_6605 [Parafrankia sp. EUN1f]